MAKRESRCCENCGRMSCVNSVLAIHWDECVNDGFTKWWMPKKEDQNGLDQDGDGDTPISGADA